MAKKLASDTKATGKGLESRRNFLGKLGLGAAALAVFSSVPFLGSGKNSSGRNSAGDPGSDSIFNPRQDQS